MYKPQRINSAPQGGEWSGGTGTRGGGQDSQGDRQPPPARDQPERYED